MRYFDDDMPTPKDPDFFLTRKQHDVILREDQKLLQKLFRPKQHNWSLVGVMFRSPNPVLVEKARTILKMVENGNPVPKP